MQICYFSSKILKVPKSLLCECENLKPLFPILVYVKPRETKRDQRPCLNLLLNQVFIGPQKFPNTQKPVTVLRRTLGCRYPAKWTSSHVDWLVGDGLQTSWQGGSCQVHSPHMIRSDAQFPDCCSSTRAKIFGSFYWLLPIRPQIVSSEENSALTLQMRRITQNASGLWNICCISRKADSDLR